MIPLPSLVVTLLLRNHMPYRSYKSQRANSARSEITDAETDGMSRGPTQNVSARLGPKHNFHTPQKANAPGAHAREDRCQNRPYVQRTNTMCSLGKNRCTFPNVFARQEPMHNFQCVRSARTNAQLPMCLLGKNQCTTSNVFARQGPMHNFHTPRKANAPGTHAREDRCQNRPHVQRTNTKCSLGKNRCTTSISLRGQIH